MIQKTIPQIISNADETYHGNLIYYFKILCTKAENICNPYHNLRHMLHVMWECYNGAIFHKLSEIEIRILLIAAMFHDFNHSGKMKGQDNLEVQLALDALDKYINPNDILLLDDIKDLIKSTEYPHKIDQNNLTLSKKILLDADMSQTFSEAWIQQTIVGLQREMNVKFIKFLQMQIPFLESLEFHSEWATLKFTDKKENKIQEIKKYLEFINS